MLVEISRGNLTGNDNFAFGRELVIHFLYNAVSGADRYI